MAAEPPTTAEIQKQMESMPLDPDIAKIYREARIAFLDKAMQEYDQIVNPYLIYIKSFSATMAIMKKKRQVSEAAAPQISVPAKPVQRRMAASDDLETKEMNDRGEFF